MALASCGKHPTYTFGCAACDAAERARRSQKEASRQARQVQRDVRTQSRLTAEQTAVQEEINHRIAEQSALQREQNQLLSRQNALLAQQATDEAAFRWGMWLQTPDGQKLEGWIKRRVTLADTMREASRRWSDAWAPLIAQTESEARRDVGPRVGILPSKGRDLSLICSVVGLCVLIVWVVAQPFIDLAVKWRLLASLLLIVTWMTLAAKLSDGGEEARRRYEKEQEDDHKRRIEQRTAHLLTGRYGIDPRGTTPWVGGLSASDVERYTLDLIRRARATYQLPAGMSMPSLTLRDWRPSTPVEARKALLLLAPWADNVPEEPEDSDVRVVDESPTETRARQQSRVRHMVEMMSFYETAWAHAWSEYEDQHGSLGFDPSSSAPWEGPARSTDLEETIEAGEDPVLPELVLREPAEDWPTAARDLIDRIVNSGDLPAVPPPSYPAF